MTPLAKGLGVLFGLPAVLAVVFVSYFELSGEGRMKHVCGEVKPGMGKDRLARFIEEYSLDGAAIESGVVMLASPRSYGRHACKVTMEAGAVRSADYQLLD